MKQDTYTYFSTLKDLPNRIVRSVVQSLRDIKSFYTYELNHECAKCGFAAKNVKEVEQHIIYQKCSRGKIPLEGN